MKGMGFCPAQSKSDFQASLFCDLIPGPRVGGYYNLRARRRKNRASPPSPRRAVEDGSETELAVRSKPLNVTSLLRLMLSVVPVVFPKTLPPAV